MALDCPKCGSASTQKLSAIFEAGTATIQTGSTHLGVGLSGDGLVPVLGSSSTSGVQQSELAKRAAPPAKKGIGCGEIGAVLVAPPLLGLLAVFLCFVVGWDSAADWVCPGVSGIMFVLLLTGLVLAGREAARYNATEWPPLQSKWERSWYCHRCAEVFVLDAGAAPAEADQHAVPSA